MITELAPWQAIALTGLAVITLFYIFRFRVWAVLATGADLLFVLALASCVASITFPPLFSFGARLVVDASPLPATLIFADTRLDALEALPGELIARALARVGYQPDDPDKTARDDALQHENQYEERAEGRIESKVRPAVESLISLLLRAIVLACSLFVLMVCLALRASTSTTQTIRQLTLRLEALEAERALPSPVKA